MDRKHPDSSQKKCVFLFVSVHQVMKAETLFKKKGLRVDLIPVPREISSDCGVAVELPWGSRKEALHCLSEHHLPAASWYLVDQGRFEAGVEE